MGLGPLQELLGQLDYPMYIVTTAANGDRSGCLVGFATQSSLQPPRLLVCVSQANHTHPIAIRATTMAVHFPRGDDLSLARLFGEETGDATDKFEQCSWRTGPDGVPVLEDVRGWVVGSILDRWPAGDHTAFLLEPTDSGVVDAQRPALMFRHAQDFSPGHPA